MQFPNNNDKQGNNPPPGGGKPPQFPQDWRRWMWPALLVLFLVWSLLALPELLSGRSGTAPIEISYSSLFRQVEAGNVSQLLVRDSTGTGIFANPITIETTQGVDQQVPAGTRFTVELPGSPRTEQVEPIPASPAARGGQWFVSSGWYSGTRAWVGWQDLDQTWAKTAQADRDAVLTSAALHAARDGRC